MAIGGGNVGLGETFSIDRRFVALADVAHPKLLFIPTASNDAEEYVTSVVSTFGDRLGCTVDTLKLYSEDRWLPRIVAKLEAADLIYVGGGNTKAMLAKWREVGMDREMKRVVLSGKPVGGVSAGAICWFRVGNSDWPQFENIPDVNTARLDCLGLVDLVACPHTRDEPFRLAEFKNMMSMEKGVGLGLDDGCAIQILDETYRFISSQETSRAHIVVNTGTGVEHFVVEPHDDFRSLTELIGHPGSCSN